MTHKLNLLHVAGSHMSLLGHRFCIVPGIYRMYGCMLRRYHASIGRVGKIHLLLIALLM